MPRLQFKKKCMVCKNVWVLAGSKEYTICTPCHLKQISSEEITEKKYAFLNLPKEVYEKSRFLRNIKQSYLRYKELTDKQIEAFKNTVKDLKKNKKEE